MSLHQSRLLTPRFYPSCPIQQEQVSDLCLVHLPFLRTGMDCGTVQRYRRHLHLLEVERAYAEHIDEGVEG